MPILSQSLMSLLRTIFYYLFLSQRGFKNFSFFLFTFFSKVKYYNESKFAPISSILVLFEPGLTLH